MHELGIAIRIVDIASKVAEENGAPAVEAVNVQIGELTGIVPEALLFSFEAAVKGSCLGKARLVIDIIPAQARCNQCQTAFSPDHFFTVCTTCGNTDCEIISGKELFVQSIIPADSQ